MHRSPSDCIEFEGFIESYVGLSVCVKIAWLKQLIREETQIYIRNAYCLEKVFDKLDCNKLWNILYKCTSPPHLIKTINCLYNSNIIQMVTSNKMSKEISINHGVRQGYSLSPTVFSNFIGHMLQTWKTVTNPGIWMNNLYADNHIILQKCEHYLHTAIYKLTHYNCPACFQSVITSYLREYTGCHRRNGPNLGRVFLMLNYTDITQNTYVQSWTVTEIMAREVWNFDSCYTLTDCQIHIETGRNMWFL